MKKAIMLLLLTAFMAPAIFAQKQTLTLNGQWELKSTDNQYSTTAEVPGSVFEALINQGIIEDPFYGVNEQDTSKIYTKDWNYSRTFEVSQKLLSVDKVFLVADGIDTIAEISINGKKAADTANMHRQYRFDISDLLIVGENTISVTITNPIEVAENFIDKYKADLTLDSNYAIPGVAYLRKAWFSFGWDWGPKMPDSGIWRDIYIEAPDSARIESVQVSQSLNTELSSAEIDININPEFFGDKNISAEITLEGHGVSEKTTINLSKNNQASFTVKNPELWWIYELGKPSLYNITVDLTKDSTIIDSYSTKIGIRKLELIRDKDKWGETFYFKLNNVAVFAKGANWIPSDAFIPRGTKLGLIEKRLEDAVKANFNMIRVWGGGIYEDDRFYNYCDENGLLVWQDFAYACNPTPAFDWYYDEASAEAEYNIKRLRNHPSLALWCGNNEIEKGWKEWGYIVKYPSHKKGYKKIFEEILPELVAKHNPQTTYWPSSPSNGIGEGGSSNSPNKGDSHYWAVWHSSFPFSAYRNFDSRFMSEFGFQSFPGMRTIAEFCPEDQYDFYSPVMKNHQKNGAGNKKISYYMKKRFSIPTAFDKQVILSQLTQAEAMEYGIDHWRRNRHDFHCMGALYWQFNDLWPTASWSSVDYYGRWKALQYFSKRFYNPVYCSVAEFNRKAEFWGVNDTREEKNVTLKWTVAKADGTVVNKGQQSVIIPPADSILIKDLPLQKETFGCRKYQLIAYWELLDEAGNRIIKGGRTFKKPKFLSLKDPELSLDITKTGAKEFKVIVSAKENTIYAFLRNDKYDFLASDNFFYMKKGETDIITVTTEEDLSIEEFKATTTVGSLYSLTH